RTDRRVDTAWDHSLGPGEHLVVGRDAGPAAHGGRAPGRRAAGGVAERDHRAAPEARSANQRDRWVRIRSAPARLIAVRCSSATASWSIHPLAAAASSIEYSPLTWEGAAGTSTRARTAAITSR